MTYPAPAALPSRRGHPHPMIVQHVFTAGRVVSTFPKLFLGILGLAILIKVGCVGPENYPPECEARHVNHAAFVADNPDVCP